MTNPILPRKTTVNNLIGLANNLTPEERAEQLRLSRNLAAMFKNRAANEANPDWRAVWNELAKLHEAAIRNLEAGR